jgi:enoyl-CoA hydratase/carnithine racemase
MYEDIHYETGDGIATITIDRPDVYNAFRRQTILELNSALREVIDNDSVYALVLAGAGDGFCAGADVNNMPNWHEEMTKEEYAGYLWGVQNIVRQLQRMKTPSVAAVGGPAIGAGCDFALACDVRVVGPDAVLREGFVRIGLVPGDGGGWLLSKLIGESKAKEYLLTGRDITPEEAVDIGLATEVAGDPPAAAHTFAEEVRDLPAVAVQYTNDLIDQQYTFEEYCERAIEYQWDCVNDSEHHEAIAAFGEKRDPEYDRDYA